MVEAFSTLAECEHERLVQERFLAGMIQRVHWSPVEVAFILEKHIELTQTSYGGRHTSIYHQDDWQATLRSRTVLCRALTTRARESSPFVEHAILWTDQLAASMLWRGKS